MYFSVPMSRRRTAANPFVLHSGIALNLMTWQEEEEGEGDDEENQQNQGTIAKQVPFIGRLVHLLHH
jgi:hypothetical protein